MKNEFYVQYLVQLPEGLERFVAETLLNHRGQDLAIPRVRLVGMAASKFPNIREIDRTVRRAIEKLREKGWLIGMSHKGDGYFLITNKGEYEEFRDQYVKLAKKTFENAASMDATAKRLFSGIESKQLRLIN
jgi:hypothetical protein